MRSHLSQKRHHWFSISPFLAQESLAPAGLQYVYSDGRHGLISRHWCCPLDCWMLRFRLRSFFLPTGDAAKNASRSSRYLVVPIQLLDMAITTKTTAFVAGVPWVLEGFVKALKNESDEASKARIMGVILSFKVFGADGASTSAECIEWAKRVLLDLGVTEVGGTIDPIPMLSSLLLMNWGKGAVGKLILTLIAIFSHYYVSQRVSLCQESYH